jgi:hypothetical protein
MATVKKIKKYQSGGSSEKGWKSMVDLIKKASKADSVAKKPYYKLDKSEARLPKQKGGGVTKKAQDGVRADSYAKGTYTGKYETPGGTRYYQGSSPDISTAMKIAANKARSNSADSLSSSMVKKKSGGKMKKAQSGIGMDTKLRDVPKIAKDKITDLYGKASNRVKNATVRDAVDVAVPSYGLARRVFDNNNKKSFKPAMKNKYGGLTKKAKSGGSFPDLNKDGKITKADILKGRGVIAKSGMKMKKK